MATELEEIWLEIQLLQALGLSQDSLLEKIDGLQSLRLGTSPYHKLLSWETYLQSKVLS